MKMKAKFVVWAVTFYDITEARRKYEDEFHEKKNISTNSPFLDEEVPYLLGYP